MIAAAFSAVKLVWKMQQYAAYVFKLNKTFWACNSFPIQKAWNHRISNRKSQRKKPPWPSQMTASEH
jgi:hypothetical protein